MSARRGRTSAPALVAVALAAGALVGGGCASGGEDRTWSASATVEPPGETLTSAVHQWVEVRFVRQDRAAVPAAARALAALGLPPEDLDDIAALNGHLLSRGAFLSHADVCGGDRCQYIVSLHEVAGRDAFTARLGGEAVGRYELVRLGRRLFQTGGEKVGGRVVPTPAGLPDIAWAQFYRLRSGPVMILPYRYLQQQFSREELPALLEYYALHELGHGVLGYRDEILADLFALSAPMERDVTTAGEIARYLGGRRLTYSPGLRAIVGDLQRPTRGRYVAHSEEHNVARIYIWKGLGELARHVSDVDPRYPADPRRASDEQLAAMAYVLYKQYLDFRQHPGHPCALADPRLPQCRLRGSATPGRRAAV